MNIPNALTAIRFCLILVFVYVFYSPAIEHNLLWATVVFLISGITDLLDGFIARKYNMITRWGKLMDPLADKLMLITVLICLWDRELVPFAAIAIVAIKEITMIVGAVFLYKKDVVVQANLFGKTATFMFYVAIVALVFDIPFADYILGVAIAATLFALVQYGYINIVRHVRQDRG